jgi:hypothetical protein
MNIKFLIAILLLIGGKMVAQNIPVGSIDLAEIRARNEQLLGRGDSLVSFSIRPLIQNIEKQSPIQSENDKQQKLEIKYLPISLKQQYNTFSPLGRNDGAMIPAKGYQMQFSTGFYANYGALSIQLKPEYVAAANPSFETFPLTESNTARQSHIYYLNTSDIPEHFGDKPYNRLFWGQSSIKIKIKNFDAGISTENLWWGPGQYNSIIMSNNAPGFLHFTLNTRKPIKTFLGSFEGQLISGKLVSSGLDVSEAEYVVDGVNLKVPKLQQWRYINGLTINYRPKWIPGLFIGLNRVFQVYNTDLGGGISDYFPVLTPFQKSLLKNEDAKSRDQLASIFFRWVLKESKAEFYVENGWNDSSSDLWDLFDSPEHSKSYLMGFSKIFMLNKNEDSYLKVNFESTRLEQSADRLVRPAGAWYQHGIIFQGYTQMSQVIGAGIGPGGNSQTLDFSVWNKDRVWGIQWERYAHNMDYYYDAYSDYNHKWVDMNLNTYAYRRYGKLGIQAKLNTAFMRGYQWQQNNPKLNVQVQFTLEYHL